MLLLTSFFSAGLAGGGVGGHNAAPRPQLRVATQKTYSLPSFEGLSGAYHCMHLLASSTNAIVRGTECQ